MLKNLRLVGLLFKRNLSFQAELGYQTIIISILHRENIFRLSLAIINLRKKIKHFILKILILYIYAAYITFKLHIPITNLKLNVNCYTKS